MATPKILNINEEDMWVDGYPSSGINTCLLLNTGSEKYWVDGATSSELYPLGNNATGRFLILFDE